MNAVDIISLGVEKYGTIVISFMATTIIGIIGKHFVDQHWARNFLVRLIVEAKAAVLEVQQTWVDKMREARGDGVVTDDEKRGARAAAITTLRSNLGRKGLERLGRIIGLDDEGIDRLLSTHVEAQVQRLKLVKSGAVAPVIDSQSPDPSGPPLSPQP